VTLRVRLTAALAILLAVGLAVFGYATYEAYSRSEYQRLDDQLRSSVPFLSGQLAEAANIDVPGGGGTPRFGGPGPRPAVVLPVGTYAELRDGDGTVLSTIQATSTSSQPKIPTDIATTGSRYYTVGSTSGSGTWRVLATPAPFPEGARVVAAVPTTDVTASLHRLILIEGLAALALLAVLTTGSWFILRQGLRPLEHMAGEAREISAGDLSHRVSPADDHTEVGQLGLALNTMLGEIETAFREREETEQRLRQFLADASHELRTPLTSIQGFAELYRLGTDSEYVNEDVVMRRIEEESARMKILVEDLLLLARLDQTRPVEKSDVDLAVLAADACSDAVAAAPDRPVSLDAPEPVVISGDADHLRQAIANLVTNAIAHTPDGSPVEVGAHLHDGYATVTVRDHGPGLSDEALEHVFDRFWQADRARAGAGVGLGLAIVAAIAQEHGGVAVAASDPAGGAVFTLRLPLVS
jgi:two-component system OmpR family sensor kinase